MYYAMRMTGSCATRFGRRFSKLDAAIKLARPVGGYVEQYGVGVVWTPRAALAPLMH